MFFLFSLSLSSILNLIIISYAHRYIHILSFFYSILQLLVAKIIKMFIFINHSEKRMGNLPLAFIKSLENTTHCWSSSMAMMKNSWLGLKAKLPTKPNAIMSVPERLLLSFLRLPAFLSTRLVLFMLDICFFRNSARAAKVCTSGCLQGFVCNRRRIRFYPR